MLSDNGPKLGVTLYSFTPEWHAREYTFAELVEKVAELELGPGLEFIGHQSIRSFPEVSDEFVREFRTLMEKYELEPSALDGLIDKGLRSDRMLTPDECFDYVVPQMEAAQKLGFPVLRIAYGGFYEIAERLVPVCERLNVKVGIEIHAPHSPNHPTMLRLRELFDRLDTPYFGFVPDFGATTVAIPHVFLDGFQARGVPADVVEIVQETWADARTDGADPLAVRDALREQVCEMGADEYAQQFATFAFEYFGHTKPEAWVEVMPQVLHVHAKFFEIDENGEDPCVPHAELIRTFRDNGYTGYFSSEYEGWQWEEAQDRLIDGFAIVQAHNQLGRKALAEPTRTAAV